MVKEGEQKMQLQKEKEIAEEDVKSSRLGLVAIIGGRSPSRVRVF